MEVPHREAISDKLAGNCRKSLLWTVITPIGGVDAHNDFETDGLVT
jgi:hypothetical protein